MSSSEEEQNYDFSEESNSLQDLLGVAIRAEIEAAEIYRRLLNQDLNEETRQKVEKLVEQEENHEETFWSIMKDFFPEEEITLPENSGITNPVEISEDLSLEELFQTAMDSEKESEEFYNTLREKFEDKEAKRTLGFLAASEREHYETLKEELKKIN